MKKTAYIRLVSLLTVLLTVFFCQCGTEKNTPVTRSYHNLTSYYNILFNGRESYNEGLKRYTDAYQYDFTRILPLFEYGNEELSENITPQMERTIEKCSKLIRLHSITSKPEKLQDKRKLTEEEKTYYNKSEYNKFADDAYLLMGKAYFWEMQYQIASNVLSYASREFKDETIRNKAKIWLSRSNIELGQFREAGKILKDMEEMESFPAALRGDFLATYADLYIKQDQYQQAIAYLKKAIKHTGDKKNRVKYTFILAQLYEETNDPDQAFQVYDRVVQMNPEYKMEFNSKLKRAWLYKLTNQGGETVKKELEKMLRNDKNEEYLDQIYFALGKIAMEENNLTKAIDYYKNSVAHNSANENQKGLSYLAMADIFFEKKDYSDAQAYYDSAVTSLESNYPGYTDLYIKTQHLTKLVDNLNTIERQDSLQNVANMEPSERNQLISQLIEKHQQEEIQRREQQQNQQYLQNQRMTQNTRQTRNEGEWYFYSPTAVQQGKSEFKRRWGDRELKDNWRISSKSQADFGNFAEQTDQPEESSKEQFSRTNRKYYLQDIPLTDSAMQASHNKIKEAYFNLGKIYMNDLNNKPKAIEAFEELNGRYPDHPFKLSTYYNLYKLNKNLGDNGEAERYKNRILREFPESNHAKILENPDYFRELESRKDQIEKLYAETLELYKNQRYGAVLNNCKEAQEKFKDAGYLSKFSYLEALTIGQTGDIVSFRNSLQSLAENYPETEVAGQANDILSYLQKTELQQINKKFLANKQNSDAGLTNRQTNGKQQASGTSEQQKPDSLYTLDRENPYYFVIITNPENVNVARLRFDLINFNLDYFLQKDYNTESDQFNEFFNIITVKKFQDYDAAKKYYDLLNKREERVFSEIQSDEFRYFYISVKNYLTLLDKKSIIEYINFFNETLL